VAAGDAAPRVAGRIVFASEFGSTLDNTELYSIQTDGSRRLALSRNPGGADGGARWSPDGTHLAFWAEHFERPRWVRGLYLMRRDGRGKRRLTPADLHATRDSDPPSWSPDGASIAFSGDRGSRHGIWTIRTDGRRLRFLARDGIGPVWSPKGDRIAFGGGEISVVPALGGTSRRLTRGPDDSGPAWSPDGTRIAFVRSNTNGEKQALLLVSANGGSLRRIFGGTPGVTMGREPHWSPDGQRLLFEVNSKVYVARVRARGATRLHIGDWPSWSPDGRRIVFTLRSSIYTMNLDGSGQKRVRTEVGWEFSEGPTWSPSGNTLVYALTRTESDLEIFVANADGTGLRQLTHNSAQDWSPAWSPARRRIAFVRRNTIWLMNADGTGVRRLFAGTEPSWSPDGSQLAFVNGGVFIRRISGGTAMRIVDGYSPAWSPNRGEIAFVRGTRILAVDLASRVERTIADVSSSCPGGYETSIGGPDWSPNGTRLVYAVICDDGRFPFTSAEVVRADGTERRALRLNGLDTTRLAWSPDGARVAFVAENEKRRVGTAKLDGTGLTTVVRDTGGAAYLDPDW
jgi:TolB protein